MIQTGSKWVLYDRSLTRGQRIGIAARAGLTITYWAPSLSRAYAINYRRHR